MDVLTEGEQWEALKAWLRQNGVALVAGVAIGVVALVGWRWWTARQETQALEANARYEKLLVTFDSGDIAAAATQVDELRRDFPKSAYVAPAMLAAARVYVGRNELDKAAESLKAVMDGAGDEQLRPIARLRLARVQIAQGKPDEALATLNGLGDPGSFKSAYAQVRGDALYAKDDRAGALREYELARDSALRSDQTVAANAAAGTDVLSLKINDLKAEPAATVASP